MKDTMIGVDLAKAVVQVHGASMAVFFVPAAVRSAQVLVSKR